MSHAAPVIAFTPDRRDVFELDGPCTFAECDPDIELTDANLDTLNWHPASIPCTVAAACLTQGLATDDLDAKAFLFRRRFALTSDQRDVLAELACDGLATFVELWLNGHRLGATANMFRRYRFDVRDKLATDNELVLRFWPATTFPSPKVARARWLTRICSRRNLRTQRTTLLGRMPGWTPDLPAVGPWRSIRLCPCPPVVVARRRITTDFDAAGGHLDLELELVSRDTDHEPRSAWADVAGRRIALEVTRSGDHILLAGQAHLPDVQAWWPHTHGSPVRYALEVGVATSRGDTPLFRERVGFRRVQLSGPPGPDFALSINDVPVFCRGANWMPLSATSLHATKAAYRRALLDVVANGMNMVRVPGTSIYEADAFYETCDELGVLVWQDLMFANMDYPENDPAFTAEVRTELDDQFDRWAARVCLTVVCGGSEVEQQAAMMGKTRSGRSHALFDEHIPALCRSRRPDVPYWPSTPSGPAALPFHVSKGTAHYFGVGAYRRSIDDMRTVTVRFATECLAFASLPDESRLAAHAHARGHDITAAQGVPRDQGADWDFLDVTDHYLTDLFGANANQLRRDDPKRHRQLARLVPGTLAARVGGYWRARASGCHGALILHLRDLAFGSGWGLFDADGEPKLATYALRRVWAPRALWTIDDGLDGLRVCLANDHSEPWSGTLSIEVCRDDGHVLERASVEVRVDGHGEFTVSAEAVLDRFVDPTYAYRFGAREHGYVHARFESDHDAQACVYTPQTACCIIDPELDLTTALVRNDGGQWVLELTSNKLARAVTIDCPDHRPDDNAFDLVPHTRRRIRLYPRPTIRDDTRPVAQVSAINLAGSPVEIGPTP